MTFSYWAQPPLLIQGVHHVEDESEFHCDLVKRKRSEKKVSLTKNQKENSLELHFRWM